MKSVSVEVWKKFTLFESENPEIQTHDKHTLTLTLGHADRGDT